MPTFKTLVALYYLCDQAAAIRGLTADEVDRCMLNYDRLKFEFVDEAPARIGSPERAAQNALGYRGLKAWEAANPDHVATLRRNARIVVESHLR